MRWVAVWVGVCVGVGMFPYFAGRDRYGVGVAFGLVPRSEISSVAVGSSHLDTLSDAAGPLRNVIVFAMFHFGSFHC